MTNPLYYSGKSNDSVGDDFFTLQGFLTPYGGGVFGRKFNHPTLPEVFPELVAGLYLPDTLTGRDRVELSEDIVALAHYYNKAGVRWEKAVLMVKGGIVEKAGNKVLFFPFKVSKLDATGQANPAGFYDLLLNTVTGQVSDNGVRVDWEALAGRGIKPDLIIQKMILLSDKNLSEEDYYKALSLPMNILTTIY